MNDNHEPVPLTQLGRLVKSLENNPSPVRIVGMNSCEPLALLLSQRSSSRLHKNPILVVTPNLDAAKDFRNSIRFFDPTLTVHILPHFDVSPYSNLYPNIKTVAERVHWLHLVQNALPSQIFVAPIESLLQKTMPYAVFAKSQLTLRTQSELPPSFPNYLHSLGYTAVPTVEDVGTYCLRGGIFDIYSPSHHQPFRFELFGDIVDSIRTFDPQTQMSTGPVSFATVLPAREVLYTDDNRQKIAQSLRAAANGRPVPQEELHEILRSVSQAQPFYGVDFLLPYFYDSLDSPLDYFSSAVDLWVYDRIDCVRFSDQLHEKLKSEYQDALSQTLRIGYTDLYSSFERLAPPPDSTTIWLDKIDVLESNIDVEVCDFKTFSVQEFSAGAHALTHDSAALSQYLHEKFSRWRSTGYKIYIGCSSASIAERLRVIIEQSNLHTKIVNEDFTNWAELTNEQDHNLHLVHLINRRLPEGFRIPEEHLVFLRDEDILGKRRVYLSQDKTHEAFEKTDALSFGDLRAGDLVVHRIHGIGIYEGLKPMSIDGAESEFLEIKYKGNDRLYLPIYRIAQLNKYVGPQSEHLIDKLGGPGWAKTKTKVRSQLRDVADSLLRLYAKRAQIERPPFLPADGDYMQFENSFPYQETEDQLRAIGDILHDLERNKPMDRLVCGDVGFGKTEVAMRAAFCAAHSGKQVALIAPTTILTHQHLQNFKKRFSHWPFEIRALNRFVSNADIKKTLKELSEGKVDIVIGTHRLLSKDVSFKDLGLLIIDEEQKFGVIHKEKLRKLRENVDTIAMSATPIPRTLNMSLVGIRDLSIINTPPEDRLPTRTFVCKYEPETIRKAIESEISRGGQVFFLHNRVHSIDEAAARLRSIVPHARMAIAHGQMDEDQLEKTMLKFFNHELDVLICTAIIESGMDIPRANTIFIDNAHTFGVGQLYQLRGRVGRSKERAYCYLLLPPEKRIDATAQERLKVIQDNTALGSGLRVAQYDLELRGAGDILGEDQSGHINAVGYELYIELLEEVLREQKGELPLEEPLEPEINLRVSALLPDKYVPDIRMRLYYYKILSNIRSIEDIDRIETELHDQFGAPPEPVLNLLSVMYIRKLCRELGVKDISAGKAALSLAFTAKTRLPPAEVVRLTARENKKYQLAPDQRLKIRMNEFKLPQVIHELEFLIGLCPH